MGILPFYSNTINPVTLSHGNKDIQKTSHGCSHPFLKMASELSDVDEKRERMATAARASDLSCIVLKRESRVTPTGRSRSPNTKESSNHKGTDNSMGSEKEEKSNFYHV